MGNKIIQEAKGEKITQNIIGEISITQNNIFINNSSNVENKISSDDQVSNFIIKKELLNEFNATCQTLSNLLFDSPIKNIDSSLIDSGFSSFLKVVFNKSTFDSTKFQDLKTIIVSKHDRKIQEIIKTRLECIPSYWSGNVERIITELTNIININKTDKTIPSWLINDIAIDLRNQVGLSVKNYGQEILDSSEESVYFPLLDRISNSIKDNIIKFHKESMLEDPYSSSNTSLIYLLKDLASYYCIALLYGSLTHLLFFKLLVNEFLYSIFINDKSPVLFSKIIELNVIIHNGKEIDLLLRKYDGININYINYKSIINSISNIPIKKDADLAKLTLLKYFGLNLNDDIFVELSRWFFEFCDSYLNKIADKLSYTAYIKDVFLFLSSRFDCNDIYKFIINLCETKQIVHVQLASDIFTSLNIAKLKIDQQTKIHDIILNQITSQNAFKNIRNYGYSILIPFCKSTSISCESIIDSLKENNNDFYIDYFCLEFKTKDSMTYLDYIKKEVSTISTRVDSSAKIIFNSYSNNPYETIKNILQINNVDLDERMVEEIIYPLKNIIISQEQTAREKKSALELLIYLFFKYQKVIKWNKKIKEIVNHPNFIICKNVGFFDKTSIDIIDFYSSILRQGTKNNKDNEFLVKISQIENLPDYDKINIFRELSEILNIDNFKTIISKEIGYALIEILMANSVNKDRDVSFYAVKSLCLLLFTDKKKSILSYLEMIFPYSNWLIKKTILTKTKNLNDPIVKKIQLLGKADLNYYIRSL